MYVTLSFGNGVKLQEYCFLLSGFDPIVKNHQNLQYGNCREASHLSRVLLFFDTLAIYMCVCVCTSQCYTVCLRQSEIRDPNIWRIKVKPTKIIKITDFFIICVKNVISITYIQAKKGIL